MHEVRSDGVHLPSSIYMNSFQDNVVEIIPLSMEVLGELTRMIPEKNWAISRLSCSFTV